MLTTNSDTALHCSNNTRPILNIWQVCWVQHMLSQSHKTNYCMTKAWDQHVEGFLPLKCGDCVANTPLPQQVTECKQMGSQFRFHPLQSQTLTPPTKDTHHFLLQIIMWAFICTPIAVKDEQGPRGQLHRDPLSARDKMAQQVDHLKKKYMRDSHRHDCPLTDMTAQARRGEPKPPLAPAG